MKKSLKQNVPENFPGRFVFLRPAELFIEKKIPRVSKTAGFTSGNFFYQ